MNFDLKNITERTSKPRESGITMVIDKGSSIQECKNLIESSSKYIDFVNLVGRHLIFLKICLKKLNFLMMLILMFILEVLFLKLLQ